MDEFIQKYKTLFWDVDTNSIDIEKHKKFIIERVLDMGRLESVRALLDLYPSEDIAKVVVNSRNIKRRTAYFWKNYLDIKEPIRVLSQANKNSPSSFWTK